MDDKYFIGIMTYLVLSSFFMGILPDSLFTGKPTTLDVESTVDALPKSTNGFIALLENVGAFMGFLVKVNVFLFLPILISGLPLVITGILQMLHLFLITVLGVYIYDKARGIGG